ncbi:head-tail connector protein [Clostridium sp. AWRP]|uniref:head-tail connector protein n=1 Tax=Clostridium sp. AWRP TaxID=2212991 RepID=UPI000FDA60EF|nr:head-tail connector protein [Clostridium sp. AWRP]AZV56796.1 phage gp6-like head-tail connector protein [Clostridium sp. AWRP]
MNLSEVKEWLKVDYEDEDNTLSSLLSASEMIIKQATGVELSDVQGDEKALALYDLIQKIIVTNFNENRGEGIKDNIGLTSLYMQLEAYKLSNSTTDSVDTG